jgi:uncharacterized membrane protein YhaH (DUF805 family)
MAINRGSEFGGRSRRKEYWYFVLFNTLICFAIMLIGAFIASLAGATADSIGMAANVAGLIYSLAVMSPSLAVSIRRLHDTDHSGWWLLIPIIPILGSIVLLVFLVMDGQPGKNRFSPNPKQVKDARDDEIEGFA